MKVIVSGWYRSGTTHAYHICLNLLKDFSCHGANKDTIDELMRGRKKRIIKIHDTFFEPRDGLKIIHCIRNPIDAIGSRIRIARKEKTIEKMLESLKQARSFYDRYSLRDDVLMVDYDELYGKDTEKVRRIAEFLEVEADIEAVSRACDTISANKIINSMSEEADPRTQLRKGHIGPKNGLPGSYELPESIKKEAEKIWRSPLTQE